MNLANSTILLTGGATGIGLTFALLLKLRPEGRRVVLYTTTSKANKPSVQADLLKMVQWLSEGKISPVITNVLPLSQAAEAHRLLEQTKPVGKIVLQP